jgi:hypothetical protein
MTVHTFVICMAVGAAVVALWINVRFPRLMPWKMGRLLIHIVLALLAVQAVSPAIGSVLSLRIPAASLVAVFAIAFPVLVYNFLVGAWLIRLAQASAGGFRP